MKLYSVRAIVINSREMRDAHRILTLFSREKGKIRAVAHGVVKPTSRKRGAVQPFSYTDFLLRRGKEIDSVSQCEGREIFPALWTDLELMSYAGHASGLVNGLTAEEEPNEKVFDLLLHTLRALEKTSEVELLVRSFELKLASLLGYEPHLDECVNCGADVLCSGVFFSPASGGLVCPACSSGKEDIPCGRETVSVLKLLLNWEMAKIERLRVSGPARQQMGDILKRYMHWHMEKGSASLKFMEKLSCYRHNSYE